MIRRIRRRFIRIALSVLALAMVLVAVVINAANWIDVRGELTETLTTLAENGGAIGRGFVGKGRRSRGLQNRLDESRFFTVIVQPDGEYALSEHPRESATPPRSWPRSPAAPWTAGAPAAFWTATCSSCRARRTGSGWPCS